MAEPLQNYNLEFEIETECKAMQKAFESGNYALASQHCRTMASLISQRSEQIVEQMERERGLK